jgi:hypothetical protein
VTAVDRCIGERSAREGIARSLGCCAIQIKHLPKITVGKTQLRRFFKRVLFGKKYRICERALSRDRATDVPEIFSKVVTAAKI